MNLILVESPTKARTLTKFLQGKYRIEATMGHIRDLPKSELGVDVERNFTPSYLIPKDKQKRVTELRQLAAKADKIILATDPDREGEAIAWHVANILISAAKPKTKSKKKTIEVPAGSELKVESFARIVFHEITETAIHEALAHPRTIDMQLVDAQQARRVLDRLVGYKLSPLLWKKLSRRWLSAGRVQSVAVRVIVEREREIEAFTKENYWTIDGTFTSASGSEQLTANLLSKHGAKYETSTTLTLFDGTYSYKKTTILSEDQASGIIGDLQTPFTVTAVDKKEVKRNPQAPFTTSTLQQEAGRKLYFSAKKTMQLAQKLYEEGFISYHRTDSVNLSDKFIGEARDYIKSTYGDKYLPDAAKKYQTKSKVAQEAHEAIRPTSLLIGSGEHDSFVHEGLNRDHQRLYELIWKRALASQAKEAIFDSTTINITSANGYLFQTQGSVIVFDGYLVITGRDSEEAVIPRVSVGENVTLREAVPVAHETAPPPRYSEASLVKTLEEKDIGRPSTYAPIISTIQERQYIVKDEKRLKPTELGIAVTEFLVTYFQKIMDLPFTAEMEDKLDSVANGTTAWQPTIAGFWQPFAEELANAEDKAEKVKIVEERVDENCPICSSELVVRTGRYGKFIACTKFPNCTYTRQLAQTIDMKCPKCGGQIVMKKSRRGKMFYGCSNYPTCTFAAWKKEDIK